MELLNDGLEISNPSVYHLVGSKELTLENEPHHFQAGIFRDGAYVWMISGYQENISSNFKTGIPLVGTTLDIYALDGRSQTKVASQSYQTEDGTEYSIICAVGGVIGTQKVLIVSLQHPDRETGELRILSVSNELRFMSPLRSIEIPRCATVLQLISPQNSSTFSNRFGTLLIVGTLGAHVYFVDVALGIVTNSRPKLNKTQVVSYFTYDKEVFMQAHQGDQNPLLHLNSEYTKNRRFKYTGLELADKSVRVTSLCYLAHIEGLAVGYNIGGFEIWSCGTQEQIYALKFDDITQARSNPPITQIIYQHNVYEPSLWIASGSIYPLCYGNARPQHAAPHPGYIDHYKLQLKDQTLNNASVFTRISHKKLHDRKDSRIIACVPLPNEADSPFSDSILFLWENRNEASDTVDNHMEIHNSYAATSLEQSNNIIISSSYLDASASTALLDVRVSMDSLLREGPNARLYEFDISIVGNASYITTTVMSGAHKSINDILDNQMSLQDYLPTISSSTSQVQDFVRSLIDRDLSYLLDQYIRQFRNRIAENDEGGLIYKEYALANPKILFEASCSLFAKTRGEIQRECKKLFTSDYSNEEHITALFLRLNHLYALFESFYSRTDSTEEGNEAIRVMKNQIQAVTQQLGVVIWMVQNGLPLSKSFETSLKKMRTQSDYRRRKRSQLSNKNQWKLNENMKGSKEVIQYGEGEDGSLLFIDQLYKNLQESDDERNEEKSFYPPESASILLIFNDGKYESNNFKKQLLIMLYLLVDLQQSEEESDDSMKRSVSLVESFSMNFGIPNHVQNWIHSIYMLDAAVDGADAENQGVQSNQIWKVEESVSLLILSHSHKEDEQQESWYLMSDFKTRIMKSLFDLQHYQMALKFARSCGGSMALENSTDLSTYMRILLENSLLHEAYQFQRSYSQTNIGSDKGYVESLLFHLYHKCLTSQNMKFLFQLPLDDVEERLLISFLSSMGSVQSIEFVCIYFIQKNRVIKAVQLYRALKPYRRDGLVSPLDSIIRNCMATLSKMEREDLEAETSEDTEDVLPEYVRNMLATKRKERSDVTMSYDPIDDDGDYVSSHSTSMAGKSSPHEASSMFTSPLPSRASEHATPSSESKRATPTYKSIIHTRALPGTTPSTPLGQKKAADVVSPLASITTLPVTTNSSAPITPSRNGRGSIVTTPGRKSSRLSSKKSAEGRLSDFELSSTPTSTPSKRSRKTKDALSRSHSMQLRNTPKK